MKKIWYYIDESGSVEKGNFGVAIVRIVTDVEQARTKAVALAQSVEKSRKWSRCGDLILSKYIPQLLALADFEFSCVHFETPGEYWIRVVNAIALTLSDRPHDEKAIIILDGLLKDKRDEIIKAIRTANVKIDDLRGATEQSERLLDVPDAIAGFVRDALAGKKPYDMLLQQGIEKKQIRCIKVK